MRIPGTGPAGIFDRDGIPRENRQGRGGSEEGPTRRRPVEIRIGASASREEVVGQEAPECAESQHVPHLVEDDGVQSAGRLEQIQVREQSIRKGGDAQHPLRKRAAVDGMVPALGPQAVLDSIMKRERWHGRGGS